MIRIALAYAYLLFTKRILCTRYDTMSFKVDKARLRGGINKDVEVCANGGARGQAIRIVSIKDLRMIEYLKRIRCRDKKNVSSIEYIVCNRIVGVGV